MIRQIMQIATARDSGLIYALCNDGTVFYLNSSLAWCELPGIPQDQSHDYIAKMVWENSKLNFSNHKLRQLITDIDTLVADFVDHGNTVTLNHYGAGQRMIANHVNTLIKEGMKP